MFPVLGNILSQIYYICALFVALSGRLVAILGSYILAVRPPLQSLPITRQILLFIHSVCLSWPTHGLSVTPRTFGNEVSVLLWAVYRPILSLLDNFDPQRDLLRILVWDIASLVLVAVVEQRHNTNRLRRIDAVLQQKICQAEQALFELHDANVNIWDDIVDMYDVLDDLDDQRVDELSELEERLEDLEVSLACDSCTLHDG
jgi:hypothetical protein